MARICLDIGHGPDNRTSGVFDPGAVGNGAREHDEAKLTVQAIVPLLTAHGHSVMVIDGGRLSTRARSADEWKADFLLSVHLNSFTSPSATGTETFVHPQASQTSRRVAASVQKGMVAALGLTDRGVKQYGFSVLSGKSPACLAELVFISNPNDLKRLREGRAVVARNIADALLDEFGRKPEEPEEIPMTVNKPVIVMAEGARLTELLRFCKDKGLRSYVLDPQHPPRITRDNPKGDPQ